MAYTINMEQSAQRHYEDGVSLADAQRHDNAGYHFGLSTECVIKHVLLRSYGLRENDDAWWEHFPGLRHAAVLFVGTRADATLRRIIENENLMQEWDVKMRYAKNASLSAARVTRWKDQANNALGLLYE
ncbi:hypothetical protein [Burkholderia gladioli]|uniref:hypothetical protein n=1 Tax=Burkholderia gladioli TaxID=28095 RepID=UPI001640F218|nr:hypothetical protein [Burkholderia gladioli]